MLKATPWNVAERSSSLRWQHITTHYASIAVAVGAQRLVDATVTEECPYHCIV
ncbi:hypothetical protein J6590_079391 [Homalodisca vitripennis]|nr:hypothetical protein J6590_079391 [Homalodisca vitripennis]